MIAIDHVRRVAMSLPRTEEHLIRGRVKFRVGSLVYVAFSRDEKTMGFAFPKELRAALVEAEPDKFHMPEAADLRFNWVCVRLDAIDKAEMRSLVVEAWRMVVPRSVSATVNARAGRQQQPSAASRAPGKGGKPRSRSATTSSAGGSTRRTRRG